MQTEILITAEENEKRAVLLGDKTVQDIYIERPEMGVAAGDVFRGSVSSVVTGIQAAFVELGIGKNGFLHVADVLSPSGGAADVLDEDHQPRRNLRRRVSITNVVKTKQPLLVQVVKAPIGTKGPRLTTCISLPGRYLVLTPLEARSGISRRIENEGERRRLKQVLATLEIPKGMGVIVRTFGEGKGKKDFEKDLRYLTQLWQKIRAEYRKRSRPCLLHRDFDLTMRVVRDMFSDDVQRLVVDTGDEYRRVKRFVQKLSSDLSSRVELYRESTPLFEKYGIEQQIKSAFEKKVPLKSGGYLIIEQTEGVAVVDVNSGKFTREKEIEATALKTNQESAREIARQLRLRDIGGIIIIDFIDMRSEEDRRRVYRLLSEELKDDKAKTKLLPMSELGIIQMSRQRIEESLEHALYEDCPYCEGRGMVKSVETICVELSRRVRGELSGKPCPEVKIRAHPRVISRLLREDAAVVRNIERKFRTKVVFIEDRNLHLQDAEIVAGQP